jgi:hypothetical protein
LSYIQVRFVAGLNEVVFDECKPIDKTQMMYVFEGQMVPIGTWQQLRDERRNLGVSTVYSPLLERNLGDVYNINVFILSRCERY